MAYEIIWLPKAEERFDTIIYYLEQNWTEKIVTDFIRKTHQKLFEIQKRPKMGRRSAKMGIYEALMTASLQNKREQNRTAHFF